MKRLSVAVLLASGTAAGFLACSSFDAGETTSSPPEASVGDSDIAIDGSSPPRSDAGADADADAPGSVDCKVRCLSHHCEADGGCDPLVFVTSLGYPGNFITASVSAETTGVGRADELCRREIGDAGTFRAWLSTKTESAPVHVGAAPPTRPLYLADGTTRVADSVNALLDGGPLAPIIETATGGPISAASDVWTGTDPSGVVSAENCGNWSDDSNIYGAYGRPVTGPDWTHVSATTVPPGRAPCGEPEHLYCFEIIH